jgi:hypothetical protein
VPCRLDGDRVVELEDSNLDLAPVVPARRRIIRVGENYLLPVVGGRPV